jgi:NAD(P)-dependent dehydrogenase (short-subunit alcohol dehydrogenase family)
MIDRGGGRRIINISSSSAFRARNSPMAYATSKAGIVQLTRCAAAELGRYDINVNAIAPGITATAMTRALGNAEAPHGLASSGPLENLFHRVSQPEDVAPAKSPSPSPTILQTVADLVWARSPNNCPLKGC